MERLSPAPVRSHEDLDFLIRADQGGAALARLARLGFTPCHGSLASGSGG